MRSVFFAGIMIAIIAVFPLLFNERGDFRLTAEPTTLDLMDDTGGMLVDRVPREVPLESGDGLTLRRGDIRITGISRIDLEGIVLSRRDYTVDWRADVSSIDVVVGWKSMSDPAIVNDIAVSQAGRSYNLRPVSDTATSKAVLLFESANLSLFSTRKDVAAELAKTRPGDIIRVEGYVVDTKMSDGRVWESSEVMFDGSASTSRIVLVEDFDIWNMSMEAGQ